MAHTFHNVLIDNGIALLGVVCPNKDTVYLELKANFDVDSSLSNLSRPSMGS